METGAQKVNSTPDTDEPEGTKEDEKKPDMDLNAEENKENQEIESEEKNENFPTVLPPTVEEPDLKEE